MDHRLPGAPVNDHPMLSGCPIYFVPLTLPRSPEASERESPEPVARHAPVLE
jgi:hypothetical protein